MPNLWRVDLHPKAARTVAESVDDARSRQHAAKHLLHMPHLNPCAVILSPGERYCRSARRLSLTQRRLTTRFPTG
jgi:hypothetical protein